MSPSAAAATPGWGSTAPGTGSGPASAKALGLPPSHWLRAEPAWLERLLAIEQRAYAWPWSLGNFQDSWRAGYHMPVLALGLGNTTRAGAGADQTAGVDGADGPDDPGGPDGPVGTTLLGYAVALLGVEEVHLLNITVDPEHQGQGWGRHIMAALVDWSQAQGAAHLWLEVRHSNARAQALYQRLGFEAVGLRKRYYPASRSQREDAVVMRLALAENAAPLSDPSAMGPGAQA